MLNFFFNNNIKIFFVLGILFINDGVLAAQSKPAQVKKVSAVDNAYYNNKISTADKSMIDLFAAQTGLDKRPQGQWEALPKEQICSKNTCPQDRQIKCYRGVPENVDGCQDHQRGRLSNFVKNKIMMTPNAWSNNGIPGVMTREESLKSKQAQPGTTTPSSNTNSVGGTSHSNNSSIQSDALGQNIPSGNADANTNATQPQTNPNNLPTNNTAGIVAAAALGGLAAGQLANDNEDDLSPGQQQAAQLQPGQPQQSPAGPQPVQPQTGSTSGKCSIENIKQYGIFIGSQFKQLNAAIKLMKKNPDKQKSLEIIRLFGRSMIEKLSFIGNFSDFVEKRKYIYLILKGDLGLFEKSALKLVPKDPFNKFKAICECALEQKTNTDFVRVIDTFIRSIPVK
ncbi:MAG: hypothetical protein KBD31_03750 [Proteobacteria bacterium]|nr:hypothetical protein [Pseudomonadota bacterium]